jgi:hypothetical protein
LFLLFGNRLQYGHCRYQAFEHADEFREDTYVRRRCAVAHTRQLQIFARIIFIYLFK